MNAPTFEDFVLKKPDVLSKINSPLTMTQIVPLIRSFAECNSLIVDSFDEKKLIVLLYSKKKQWNTIYYFPLYFSQNSDGSTSIEVGIKSSQPKSSSSLNKRLLKFTKGVSVSLKAKIEKVENSRSFSLLKTILWILFSILLFPISTIILIIKAIRRKKIPTGLYIGQIIIAALILIVILFMKSWNSSDHYKEGKKAFAEHNWDFAILHLKDVPLNNENYNNTQLLIQTAKDSIATSLFAQLTQVINAKKYRTAFKIFNKIPVGSCMSDTAQKIIKKLSFDLRDSADQALEQKDYTKSISFYKLLNTENIIALVPSVKDSLMMAKARYKVDEEWRKREEAQRVKEEGVRLKAEKIVASGSLKSTIEEIAAKNYLKVREGAAFEFEEWEIMSVDDSGFTGNWSGHLEAYNSFNAKLRKQFLASFNYNFTKSEVALTGFITF